MQQAFAIFTAALTVTFSGIWNIFQVFAYMQKHIEHYTLLSLCDARLMFILYFKVFPALSFIIHGTSTDFHKLQLAQTCEARIRFLPGRLLPITRNVSFILSNASVYYRLFEYSWISFYLPYLIFFISKLVIWIVSC